ncbi:MAG: T9SS type A sorting domain-containing protein [Saprospiraceae bacterium]
MKLIFSQPNTFSFSYLILIAGALLCFPQLGQTNGTTNFTFDTDLSNDRLNPSIIEFTETMTTVSDCTQSGDLDYFTFEVPADTELTSIQLTQYDVADNNNRAFIGIQSGSTFTEPPMGTNVANLLGGLVFGTAELGMDILPAMGMLGGSQGFTPPLPAGQYTIWINQTGDESCITLDFQFTDNDLSDDRMTPSAISLSAGSNTVSNCVQGDPRDIDYFTIELPTNTVLSQLILTDYEVADNGNQAFIAIQEGTTFTEPSSGTDVANLLGGLVFGTAELGTDILPAMGMLGGSQGFTPPLAAQNYTFWFNQTGPISCATFQFVLSIVNDCENDLTFIDETVFAGVHQAAVEINTMGNVFIEANSTVSFQAGNTITLNSGFQTMAGSEFMAEIFNCELPANRELTESEALSTFSSPASITSHALKTYPNPFQENTTIQYVLKQTNKVNLAIYDLAGQLERQLISDEMQTEGTHVFSWNKNDLQPGMYLVILKAGQVQQTQKVVLLP